MTENVNYAALNPFYQDFLMELFDKGLTQDNIKVTYMRSVIEIAGPLEFNGTRYLNIYDRPEEQDQIVRQLLDEMLGGIEIGDGL